MARSRVDTFLDSAFGIRPGEHRRVLFMFGYLMAIVSTVIVGRSVRDALFLANYPIEQLPFMYIGVAISVSIAAYAYSRVADKRRRDKTIKQSLALGIMLYGLCWSLMHSGISGGWMYPTLYLLVEIISMLSVIQFWTFANDIFSSREAKRLFGVIGAGGVISNVLIGFIIGGAAETIGAENLLLFCVSLLAVAYYCVHELAIVARADLENVLRKRKPPKFKIKAESGRVLHSKHLQIIAGMVAVTVLTVTLVDYQFKHIARIAYNGDKEALASFFGYFYGVTGLLASLIQFFLTGRILNRVGIVVALLLLPLSILSGVGAMFAVPAIPAIVAATMTKGAENTFRYTINDATMQLLYVPVPSHQRGRAKAFIDGILKPIFIGIAGLLILLLTRLFSEESIALDLAYMDLVFVGAWLILVFSIRTEYVRSLLDTLRSRRLDLDASWVLKADETTSTALREALASDNDADVLHALELLDSTEMDMSAALVPLLAHESETIRITVLRHIERSPNVANLEPLKALLDDESEHVRAAAIGAYCCIGGGRALKVAEPFLTDESPDVRASAVAGLVKYGGIDGILLAAETLKALIKDPDPDVRIHGAKVLSRISVRNFYQPVLELLDDDVLRVRIAAIEAASQVLSPELVPRLIHKLKYPETARAASRALAAFGDEIQDVLLPVMRAKAEDIRIRRRIPHILAITGTEASFKSIMKQLVRGEPDRFLRYNLARAAAKLRERLPRVQLDAEGLEEITVYEIQAAYQDLATIRDLRLDGDSLLREALERRHERRLGLVFRLLEIRYPARTIQLIWANLDSKTKVIRANAIELADNVLSSDESRILLPLLERHALEQTVKLGEDMFEIEKKAPDEWLSDLLRDDEPWMVTCAIYEARTSALEDHQRLIMDHLRDEDAVVRETACVTLSKILSRSAASAPDKLRRIAEDMQKDETPAVRHASRNLFLVLGASPS